MMMRTMKTMGHTTTKFNRKESRMMLHSFTNNECVFDAKLSQDSLGLFVEVLYDKPAIQQVRSLAGIFGDEPRMVTKRIEDLNGIRVRLSSIENLVVMYIGTSLLVSLGFTREERNGTARIIVDLLPEGLKIRHFKEGMQDVSSLPSTSPIAVIEKPQIRPMEILPVAPRNEMETLGWLVYLLVKKPDSFPFQSIERFYPKAFPDLDVVMKNGTKAKAEVEFTADKWNAEHTEQMTRGTRCDFAIVWDMGRKIRSNGGSFGEAVRLGMKVLVLKEIAQL